MTYYGINPGTPLSLGDHHPHKKHDKPAAKPAVKASEVVARCGDHSLVRTMSGTWYDRAPAPHGSYMLGTRLTEQEARRRWRDKLKREGAM